MTKPRKSQKPAYIVKSSPKMDVEKVPTERPHSQVKSLMGSPAFSPGDRGRPSSEKRGHHPFGQPSAQEKPARVKTSRGPAQSLMSIDFSSMGMNSLNKPSVPHASSQRYGSHASEDESHSNRHDVRRHQQNRESSQGDRTSMWRGQQHSHRAPLIVDMSRPKNNTDLHSSKKPKSLLGDYWTSIAHKPASLMDLTAQDSMGHYTVTAQPEPFSRPTNFPSGSNPQRSLLPSNKREGPKGPMPKKRSHPTGDGAGEAPEKKVLKNEPSQRLVSQLSSRLAVCGSKRHVFVMVPAVCSTLYLHGRVKLKLLRGHASVLTHHLQPGAQYDVFSPSSGSLLPLHCADTPRIKADDVKTELAKFGISQNDKSLESLGDDTVAILKLTRLRSAVCDYITSFIPYTQLFTAPQAREKDLHSLRGVTLSKLGVKLAPMKEMGPLCMSMASPDYQDVLGRFTTQINKSASKKAPPIWLCCGAKNSGKSTFCRMLINTALGSVKTVGYLECDVGQTEFSPPATLSFHVIDKPILGQPFCHQRQAEKLVFYGETAAGQNPSSYVKCLKHVLSAYTDMLEKPPLIVNTMGFPEGIGLMLLIDTVRLVQPDMVVQIESHNQAANFPAITHELVSLEEGWTFNKSPVTDPRRQMEETHAHELILLPTLLNQRRDFSSLKLKPVDLRNLSLLASLSLGLESGLTLTSTPPYAVPFKQMAIHVCHHRSLSGADILAAVDATVVALCSADISQARRENDEMPFEFDEMPICDCLGLAVVRGIDVPRGLMYIVTSLPRVRLGKVNTILKGSISLPDQIVLKQKSSGLNFLPYVDALAPSTGVSAVRPRARMPRLTLGAKNQ